jgi:hypothetical protein
VGSGDSLIPGLFSYRPAHRLNSEIEIPAWVGLLHDPII